MKEQFFQGQCVRLQDVWPKDYEEDQYLGMTIDIKELEKAWESVKDNPLFGTISYFYFQDLGDRWDKYPPVELDGFFEGSFNDKGKK